MNHVEQKQADIYFQQVEETAVIPVQVRRHTRNDQALFKLMDVVVSWRNAEVTEITCLKAKWPPWSSRMSSIRTESNDCATTEKKHASAATLRPLWNGLQERTHQKLLLVARTWWAVWKYIKVNLFMSEGP